MKVDVLTLFPKAIDNFLNESIVGNARESGKIEINCTNIRNFSSNKHKNVDDYPYGGGSGMVMSCQPIIDCYKSLQGRPLTIYFTPRGRKLDQNLIDCLSLESHIALLCGHYEGVDERAVEEIVDLEISLGDFVLTGGEIPAIALIDSICRQLPNVIKSAEDESFNNGLLEYPQYTRPEEFNGRLVPSVLLSGNHKEIADWRYNQSLEITRDKRTDLLQKRRVGILGGTFNPIHNGHIEIAQKAAEELKLDEVVFVVANDPYHKKIDVLEAAIHRMNMVLIALENLPTLKASCVDIKRNRTTYSIDTIYDLRKAYPFAEFFFIVGEDIDYSTWYEIEKLEKLVTFVKFKREIPVSSSEFRQNFNFEFINPKVEKYIRKHNLYGVNSERNF